MTCIMPVTAVLVRPRFATALMRNAAPCQRLAIRDRRTDSGDWQRSCFTSCDGGDGGGKVTLRSSLATAGSTTAVRTRLHALLAAFALISSCSQIRITFQPSLRSVRVTRRSRSLVASILFFQNLTFDDGNCLHFAQPCQKQPSTNTATLRPGQAKSGLPATGQCFR